MSYRMSTIHEEDGYEYRVGESSDGINIDCVRSGENYADDEDDRQFDITIPALAKDALFERLR